MMAFSITPKIALQCPSLKAKTIDSRPKFVHALTSGGNVWRGNTVPQPLQLSAVNAWPDVMSLPLWQPVEHDTCQGEAEGVTPSRQATHIRSTQPAQAEPSLNRHLVEHRSSDNCTLPNTDSTEQPVERLVEQPVEQPIDSNNNNMTTESKPLTSKARSRRKKETRVVLPPSEPKGDARQDRKCSEVNVDEQRMSANNVDENGFQHSQPEMLNFSFGSILVLPTTERNTMNGVATADGTVLIALGGGASVEITVDGGVRLSTGAARLAINADRSAVDVVHSVGRVFQEDNDVAVITHVPVANKRYVSFVRKGVTFTSDRCAQTYLLDEGGLRTLHKRVWAKMLATDFSWSVLYDGSRHGADHIADAVNMLARGTSYNVDASGRERWRVGGVTITLDQRGQVRVQNNRRTFQLATSLVTGDTFVNAPGVHCTLTDKHEPSIYVSRRQIKVTYTRSDNKLRVRNGNSSADFDTDGKLIIT